MNSKQQPIDIAVLFPILSFAFVSSHAVLYVILELIKLSPPELDPNILSALFYLSIAGIFGGFMFSIKTISMDALGISPHEINKETATSTIKKILILFIISSAIIESGAILGLVHGLLSGTKETGQGLIVFGGIAFGFHAYKTMQVGSNFFKYLRRES